MNKQLDDELKRILGKDCVVRDEPDYFDRYEARVLWAWKLAKAVTIAAFVVVGGCALLGRFL